MSAVNLMVIGEVVSDPDETHALLLLSRLVKTGQVNVLAVVANHFNALERARSGKWALSQLGCPQILVGQGMEVPHASIKRVEEDPRFLAPASSIVNGHEIMYDTLLQLRARRQKVTLVLNSAATDAWALFRRDPELFCTVVERVVMMGGVMVEGDQIVLDRNGFLVPNVTSGTGPANNLFDVGSVAGLYYELQMRGVPVDTVIRDAAYACNLSFALYDAMERTGHPVGRWLAGVQRLSINERWQACVQNTGRPPQSGQPHRDIDWFVSVFCPGAPPQGIPDDILPHLQRVGARFVSYDGLNTLAAVPSLAGKFKPVVFRRAGVSYRVFGVSNQVHGLDSPDAMREYLARNLMASLTC